MDSETLWTHAFEAANFVSTENNYAAPLETTGAVVKPEWIDHNGHMNVAFYLMAFDEAIGVAFNDLGLTKAYRRENQFATFVGDFHIHYARELLEGDPIRVTHQLVNFDEKRLHFCQAMYHGTEGYLAARSELISLHIDMRVRRVAPMAPHVYDNVQRLGEAHATLPKPPNLGRTIEMKRRDAN